MNLSSKGIWLTNFQVNDKDLEGINEKLKNVKFISLQKSKNIVTLTVNEKSRAIIINNKKEQN